MGQLHQLPERQSLLSPCCSPCRVIDWSRFLNRLAFSSCRADSQALVSGKTVLITGAGGSIGSALASLLMGGLARRLLFLDNSEANLRLLYQHYRQRHITLPRVEFLLVDIRSQPALERIFLKYHPQIVFHAAALKHVAPLESAPLAALETNLYGTLRLLQAAECAPVESFVNVSTDKAVNPASMLGVSKRLAELLLVAIDSAHPRKLSLRLGNVLESSGSVVPLFLQSLENRQPLAITDPEASRYFLTLEEAAEFLLRSLTIRKSSLLLPEMGAPRKITALAGFLLNELGYAGCNEPFHFTGLRDGEKCFEQLTFSHESLQKTSAHGIYRICGNAVADRENFIDDLGRLLELVLSQRTAGLIDLLHKLVPEFTPSPTLLRHAH